MATALAVHEHELVSGAQDGITRVKFANREQDNVLTASWDKTVRLYDAAKNQLLASFDSSSPVLDATFSDDDRSILTGTLDRHVDMWDVEKGTRTTLGQHGDGVRCIVYHSGTSSVVSGGWDGMVNIWDPRSSSSSSSSSSLVGSSSAGVGSKVFSMDCNASRLVVALSNRQVLIYDLRNMSTPEQKRESSLSHQTRCVKCSPDQQGYALSSIEGRISIEFFDPSETVQAKKYAFKCHRKTDAGKQILYPVNAIAYHPYGTFASGGCDGVVAIWDASNKKRICQYSPYHTSIASIDFSKKGNVVAIAASYTYEEGEKGRVRDSVYIRTVNESEVQSKKKVG